MAKTTTAKHSGWRSIFRGKNIHGKTARKIQGYVTPAGARAFNQRRRDLAKLVGRKVAGVSDADVIEYLARGHSETWNYLAKQDAGE